MEYKKTPGIDWEGQCKICGRNIFITSNGSFIHHCFQDENMQIYMSYNITAQELCNNLHPVETYRTFKDIDTPVKLIDDDIF